MYETSCPTYSCLLAPMPWHAMFRWLQYHDRDTGDLCGMLPLAIGMKVALTQHVDRSQDKLLLKGTVGRVHSWVWPENDPRPSIVYVKFEGAKWQLDGVEEPGVYPITPLAKTWFLDSRRKPPMLKIYRTQMPLTPAYAMTAHSSQGKTLQAVLLDLNVEKKVDTTFGAVAASRVRSRHDALILRPFPLWLFQRGAVEGPQLLLKTLRGEEIDWAAYREGRKPFAKCSQCQQVRDIDNFEYEQWEKIRANLPSKCMRCDQKGKGPRKRKLESGTIKYVCGNCKINKIEDCYPRVQLKTMNEKVKPVCLACCTARDHLKCSQCEKVKPVEEFKDVMATLPLYAVACKHCQQGAGKKAIRQYSGWFKCRGCQTLLPTIIASAEGEARHRRCLNCASRNTRQKDEHTCQNKGCKRKFEEKQIQGQPRKRYCPACRHKGG